ncbi:MAG: sterol desaturase family protein [Nitrospinales bacterium]
MTLAELVKAYFCYPAIQVYILLAAVGVGMTVFLAPSVLLVGLAAGAGFLAYPLAWYLLHRFILHGRFLYKSPRTAALWKRIHYDHHRDPNDLGVLFGALRTTLPTIIMITMPLGWLIGGPGGSAAALVAGLVATCFYEFCHCIQHLAYAPKLAFLRRVKKLHLAHHFHNESGNFGITNFLWDRLLGTYYPNVDQVPRSATVFNLGYAGSETTRFPWVAELSEPETEVSPRRV